ncbi:hypothetical protein FIM12_08145 [SAR202 cluster bacterium AD-804-J14_MRT_500m]|nr:hypothetical protein [SAR202 cluster bacterium AD-804-J14_MRT_500m]
MEEQFPLFLHGPVAAGLLQREGLNDEDVCQGIYHHTTACPEMSAISKVVFLADKLDPQKQTRYPYQEVLKSTAFKNLDTAVLMFLNNEISKFIKNGQIIHPFSVAARNQLLANDDF